MNTQLLRLLLSVSGLAALGGFGWEFWDFFQNRETLLKPLDIAAIDKTLPKATGFESDSAGRLLPYSQYGITHGLNITGQVEIEEVSDAPVVEAPKPSVADKLRLQYVQYVAESQASCFAYLVERDNPDSEGELYSPGDLLAKPFRHARVESVQPDAVMLAVEHEEELVRLELHELEADAGLQVRFGENATSTLQPGSVGNQGRISAEVRPDLWQIGSDDIERLTTMSDDELLSDVRLSPALDPVTRKPAGLRVRSIREGSILSDKGIMSDDVVLSVNGFPATNRAALIEFLRNSEAEVFQVEVRRMGAVRMMTYRAPGR